MRSLKEPFVGEGDCRDNAVTETLFGLLKVERLHDIRLASRRRAKNEVLDWLTFCNSKRVPPTLGYMSPMAFEKKDLPRKASSSHDRSRLRDKLNGGKSRSPVAISAGSVGTSIRIIILIMTNKHPNCELASIKNRYLRKRKIIH